MTVVLSSRDHVARTWSRTYDDECVRTDLRVQKKKEEKKKKLERKSGGFLFTSFSLKGAPRGFTYIKIFTDLVRRDVEMQKGLRRGKGFFYEDYRQKTSFLLKESVC